MTKMLVIPSINPANFSFSVPIIFQFERNQISKKTIPKTNKTIPIIINFDGEMLEKINLLIILNCKMNAVKTNSKKINKSTTLSATIVPNPLSKGTFSYFFNKTALVTSPDRGIVKLTK